MQKPNPRVGSRHRAQVTTNTTRANDKGKASGKPSSSQPGKPRPSVSSRDQQANIRQKEKTRLQVEETLFGDIEGRHVNEDANPGGNANGDDYDAFKRYLDRKRQARREEQNNGKWLHFWFNFLWMFGAGYA